MTTGPRGAPSIFTPASFGCYLVPRPLADRQVDLVAVGEPAACARALLEHVVLEPRARGLARDVAHAAVAGPDLRLRAGQRLADHAWDRAGRLGRGWRRRRRRWW